jgi:hypothetical protein
LAAASQQGLTLVNIALGNADATACPNGIPNGAQVDVALILTAVNNALNGCGGSLPPPSPTAVTTATPGTCASVGQYCDNSTVFCCSGTSPCNAFTLRVGCRLLTLSLHAASAQLAICRPLFAPALPLLSTISAGPAQRALTAAHREPVCAKSASGSAR